MPRITYIQPDGDANVVDVPTGTTIMQAALSNDIHGIVGECGGNAMCVTCHVRVADSCLDRVPAISEIEKEMLEFTASPRGEGSRLGCQIRVTDDLDGLVVHVPGAQ